MLASAILSRVGYLLNDTANVTYTEAELLLWISDGQTAIANDRPDSVQYVQTKTLTAGSGKQTLTAGDRLIAVTRNLASGVGQRHIRGPVDKETLDAFYVGGFDDGEGAEYGGQEGSSIWEYAYNPAYPETFWVYPVPTSPIDVELELYKTPVQITGSGDTLTIKDKFSNSLVDYVCYRALTKDLDNPQNISKAGVHLSNYNQSIGKQLQADIQFSPQVVDK